MNKKGLKETKRDPNFFLRSVLFLLLIGTICAAMATLYFNFFTKKDVSEVVKSQSYLEKDMRKLNNALTNFQENFDKKIEEIRKEEKIQEERNEPAGIPVKLFYYNIEKDKEIDESIPCSPDSVIPVERTISVTALPVQQTIRLLLEGNITQEEKIIGFTSEFPHPEFFLKGVLLENGILTLEFTNPIDFTTGGSCRVSLLRTQIEKTALQFEEVSQVILRPEGIFEP